MLSETTYTISDVSQKTGVASVTLRAWERRYGLIKPKRTTKGHRIYSDKNIAEIKQVLTWLNRGVAISKVSALLNRDTANVSQAQMEQQWQQVQTELFTAITQLHQRRADQICDKINKSMPFSSLAELVYQPLLSLLQQRWQDLPLGYLLEQQVWQQLWQRQIIVMTLRADKQKAIASCCLINRDSAEQTSDFWLVYASLLQSGVRVSAINANADLSSLARLKDSADLPLIIFGNHRLSPAEQKQLLRVKQLWQDQLLCLGTMVSIDNDYFITNAISVLEPFYETSPLLNISTWLKQLVLP